MRLAHSGMRAEFWQDPRPKPDLAVGFVSFALTIETNATFTYYTSFEKLTPPIDNLSFPFLMYEVKYVRVRVIAEASLSPPHRDKRVCWGQFYHFAPPITPTTLTIHRLGLKNKYA